MVDYKLFSKIESRIGELDLINVSLDIDDIFHRFSDEYDVYIKYYLSFPQADGWYHLIWDVGENSIMDNIPRSLLAKKIYSSPNIDFKPTIEFGWSDNIDHLSDNEIIKKVNLFTRMEKILINNIRAHFDIRTLKIYYCEVNWGWTRSKGRDHPFRARYILDHIYHK